MQQEPHTKTGNYNDTGVKQREKLQPPIAAICVWLFLIFTAFFWMFLRRQIPIQSEYIKIAVESMFNVGLLVLVVLQTWLYFKQSKALDEQVTATQRQVELVERSAKDSERSAIYAQRGYIIARIKSVHPVDKRLDRFYFRLRIENSGNTPANEVRVSYACGLRDKPPCEMVEGQLVCDIGFDLYKRLGVVAPNDSDPFIDTPQIPCESIEQFKLFESEKVKFYCWGTIYYEDIFNEPRHSDFCFYQSWGRREGYPCEYGNEVF